MWQVVLRDAAGNEVPAPGRSSFTFKFAAKSDLRDLHRGVARFGPAFLAASYGLDPGAIHYRLGTGPGYPGAAPDGAGRGFVELDLRTARPVLRRA